MNKGIKNKHIAVFVDFFYPHKNGVANYIENIYKDAIKSGYIIHIFTFQNVKNTSLHETYKSFQIHRLPCYILLKGTYNFPKRSAFSQLKRVFKKNRFDLINTHTRFFTSSALGTYISKKYNISHIHTEHGTSFVKHNNKLIELFSFLYDLTLGKYVIKNAQICFGVSKKSTEFAKKLGAKKTKIMYNGVNQNKELSKKEKKEFLKKTNINSKILNIVYVGRLVEAKGVQDLLHAISRLKNPYHLHVIGDGNYKKKLEDISNTLNITKKITLYGEKELPFIYSFLQCMDVFVNPSYAEGFPTSVLEAGINACTVVATNVGGTNEIILHEKTGLLIKPKHKEDLKKALLKVQHKAIRKKYALALQKHIQKNFTWKILSQSFTHQINVLTSGKKQK